ncbi:molybdopterin oxidoreductase family protein [Leptolyngbya iicbica]|uniref:Nitrate reductase n=2 Tax=Cyanophyceae TaxID=3028117 RepID=A0A4Q7EAN9_9CYAN|nr:nitrate reductase [Leptolyngbya sp. LK]RZM79671.1 nitrate reductase [Leptolyngbya sp. LK]
MTSTKTLCPYCGVGCGLEVAPVSKPDAATENYLVKGDRAHPSSQGMVCVKGATIADAIHKNRLLYPMVRDSLDEPFRRVSWDEALDAIAHRIRHVVDTQGPEAVCMYGSGQLQTEDYYTAQKLLKGCLGTNNFDANSRLCMSSAVAAYIQSFGSDGPPTCYDDLEQTDCAFLIGTNTAECHPIVFNRLRKYHRKKKGKVKLIVVDPRRTETAKDADLHLAIRPSTDITLMNGIAHILLRKGWIDPLFIEEATQGFTPYAAVVDHYPPEKVAEVCGITVAELEQAARWWGRSKSVLSLWSMGINQSAEGTAKARTLINLHLMSGQIGRPGAGPFSLTGQPNAMGGREAGGLAHILPGYRLVKNPEHRQAVETAWELPPGSISPTPGLAAWDMMVGLEQGAVGVFWVAATNPAVSMPDIERTKAALRRSPFTILQDAYYPTETAEYAHVLLPAAQWGEKSGIMTNSERTVTYCPAFRDRPGEARADWEIFAEVGRRLGFAKQFACQTSAEVYAEFVQLTAGRVCDMTGLSHQRLADEGPIQWPCPQVETPDTASTKHDKRLYTDFRFPTPNGRAQFATFHEQGLTEPPDPEFPFVLTNGRLYGHWHTQSRTGRIDKIRKMHPEPLLEMHPIDAQHLKLQSGDWVEVRSRRGQARLKVVVTQYIRRGVLFIPMHWGALWADAAECNALTHSAVCPISLQPELKASAVTVVPITEEMLMGDRTHQQVSESLELAVRDAVLQH